MTSSNKPTQRTNPALTSRRTTLSEIVATLQTHAKILDELMAWKQSQDVASAVETERDKALSERLDRIETSLREIKATFSRFLWTVVTPVIGALVLGVAVVMAVSSGVLKAIM